MRILDNSRLATAFVLAASITSGAVVAGEAPEFSKADQCIIDQTQETIRIFAGRPGYDEVIIDLLALKQECEEKTQTAIHHPRIMEPGEFYANGTHFIMK